MDHDCEKKERCRCPYCGETFIKYKCVAKTFCSRECFINDRESRTIYRECAVCGSIFKTHVSVNSIYCSRECKYKKSQEKLRRRVTKVCEVCQKVFEVVLSNSKQRFCSQKCFRLSRPKVTCKVCGREVAGQNKTYCSRECMSIDYISRFRLKSNPNWKGGKYSRKNSGIGVRQRERIKKRDNYRCRECGTEDIKKRSSDNHLPLLYIHHLVPFEEGGENDDSNLITLCIICHYEGVHGYKLKQMVHDFAEQQGCRSPYLCTRRRNGLLR